MKVEVTVLGSPSLIVLVVYVDVKRHYKEKTEGFPVASSKFVRPGHRQLQCQHSAVV